MNELENRYSTISTLLDGTEIYSRVSSSVTSLVQFEDIFNLSDLSEDLVEAGLDSNTVKLLLQSSINVNKVSHPSMKSYILETWNHCFSTFFDLRKFLQKRAAFNEKMMKIDLLCIVTLVEKHCVTLSLFVKILTIF